MGSKVQYYMDQCSINIDSNYIYIKEGSRIWAGYDDEDELHRCSTHFEEVHFSKCLDEGLIFPIVDGPSKVKKSEPDYYLYNVPLSSVTDFKKINLYFQEGNKVYRTYDGVVRESHTTIEEFNKDIISGAAQFVPSIETATLKEMDERWMHAACMTIAETGQKWGKNVKPSPAMEAVFKLRQNYDKLKTKLDILKGLINE